MKNLKRLCVAFALTLMLALSICAGEMTTVLLPPSTSQAAMQGQMSTTVTDQADSSATTTDLVADVALNVLGSVLLLF